LVNHHAKVTRKNGDVYRTLERFRERNLMSKADEAVFEQQKYNLSLVKHTFSRKEWHSSLEYQSPKDSPLNARKVQKNGLG
jgi:hypothetical protein